MAALLAFLAILMAGGLSGWHAAAFHGDEPAHGLSFEHSHDGDARPDGDRAIHLAAHAVVQGIAIPANAVAQITPPLVVAMAWPLRAQGQPSGRGPASLLRPPRG